MDAGTLRAAVAVVVSLATASTEEPVRAAPTQLSLPMCVRCGRLALFVRHRTLARRALPEPWG